MIGCWCLWWWIHGKDVRFKCQRHLHSLGVASTWQEHRGWWCCSEGDWSTAAALHGEVWIKGSHQRSMPL